MSGLVGSSVWGTVFTDCVGVFPVVMEVWFGGVLVSGWTCSVVCFVRRDVPSSIHPLCVGICGGGRRILG